MQFSTKFFGLALLAALSTAVAAAPVDTAAAAADAAAPVEAAVEARTPVEDSANFDLVCALGNCSTVVSSWSYRCAFEAVEVEETRS